MRAVIQRVSKAAVTVDGMVTGSIGAGLVVLLGVAKGDNAAAVEDLVKKILHLRVFSDDAGKMNLSLADTKGSLLVVSQFTLYGDCSKGRRPSFDGAAPAAQARVLYQRFIELMRGLGVPTETGAFQAHMQVSLVNDGPVTLILDVGGEDALGEIAGKINGEVDRVR